MKKYILITIITVLSFTALACGDANKSLMSGSRGKGLIGMLIDGANKQGNGADEPSGEDALSASTNHSSKEEIMAPKLDPLAGAAFVRPPQVNNYGTVNLSYPMEVPAGRAGMQPSVGLSYSSSGGDGLCGIGWSLSSGLGTISRTASHGELYYDYRDILTFNGKRLLKTSGSADNENGIYRCEIESDFSRFELSEAERGGVWRMFDKSGAVTIFGQDRSSRVYRPDDLSKTYIWNFSRSADLNGNFRYAVYDDSDYDSNHIIYLKEIRYTGNGTSEPARQYVKFTYKSRGDAYVSKAPGFIMRMDRLLDEVVVGWDDPGGWTSKELWKYTLVYNESEDSHRPVLSTVNSTRNATAPEFTYRPADHGFVWQNVPNIRFNDPEANPDATQYFEGDFNGDGISDLVFFNPQTGDWQAAEGKRGGGYAYKTYGNKFKGYDSPSKIQFFKGNVTGDYNGDGRSDIAFFLPQSKEFWVAEHNGKTFDFKRYGGLSINVDIFKCEWFTGDFDGNGLSDAVLFYEPTGEWFLMRNLGGRFEFIKFSEQFRNLFRGDYRPDNNMNCDSTADASDYGSGRGTVHFFGGDYNGDGRTDISIYDARSGRWWVGENYRIDQQPGFKLTWVLYREFTAPEQALFTNDRFSGDFNGDGLSDFLLFNRATGEWSIGETGNRSIAFRTFSRAPQFKDITRWLQGDFNGDGRTDIGFYSKTDGNFWIGEATPDGFRYRVYNNLSYCPDAARILGSAPLPKDEVRLENRKAALTDGAATWLMDYEFDANYETGGGEKAFPGRFAPDGKPGLLIYRAGEHKLYYTDGSGDPVVKNGNIDLGDPGVRILNNEKADRYGAEDGVMYYQKSSSVFGSATHRFNLLSSATGFAPQTAAEFDGATIADFDITTSLYLTDRFGGDANKCLLVLDDAAETPAFVLFRNGTASRLAIGGSAPGAAFFKNLRSKRSAVFMMSGDFSGGTTAQILLVDTSGADHQWYLGTIGGGVSFVKLGGAARFAPSGLQSYHVVTGAGSSTLVYVTAANGTATFHRAAVSPVSGVSELSSYSLPDGTSFKGEYDNAENPVVYDAAGAKKLVLADSRIDPLTGTPLTIARPDLRTKAYNFRWIQGDYNGDGKTDIGFFHLKEPNWYFAVTTGTVPDLISEVKNGIGGSYEFEYANSTTMDNTDDDGIPRLPMNYKVCTGLTVHDGLGRDVTTRYSYAGGYAFSAFINGYKETDYFGFGEFTVTDAAGTRTVQRYHNAPFDDFRKNRALAGAIKESHFYGSDNIEYSRTEHEYLLHEIVPSGAPLKPAPIDGVPDEARTAKSFLVEPVEVRSYRKGTLVETRVSNIELEAGAYTMKSKRETVTDHYEDGAHRATTVASYSEFDNIEETNEMRLTVKKNFEGSAYETTASYAYDGRGNVTSERARYTGSGLAAVSDRFNRYEYDGYGNRVRSVNASGSPERVSEKDYDTVLHQFVVTERALGDTVTLTTGYAIDYGAAFGGITKKTDPNGNSVYFEYDSLGRLAVEKVDADSGIETTNEYAYSTDLPLSGKVTQHTGPSTPLGDRSTPLGDRSTPLGAGATIETRVYADGMGRAVHSVRSATDDPGRKYVKSGMVVYDRAGRVIRASQADWAGDGEIDAFAPGKGEKNPTQTDYDAAGRTAKVTQPKAFDGEGETSTAYAYNDPWETIETHSVGRSRRTVKNARGQVLYVEDYGTGDDGTSVNAKIGFAYDITGNRIKKMDLAAGRTSPPGPLSPGERGSVITLDIPDGLFRPGARDTSGNNIACWRYNAFGQMTESSDPDLGYSGVSYNAFGEADSKTDGLGRVTGFAYDRLGRLVVKRLPGEEGAVKYVYDSYPGSDNTLGRIAFMDDPAQTKRFNYDKIGRVRDEARVIKEASPKTPSPPAPFPGIPGEGEFVTRYAYDLVGRKTLIEYPADPKSGKKLTVAYSHCALGVTAVTADNGESKKDIVKSIRYNEFGQMSELARGNGAVSRYAYDNRQRLRSLLTSADHNGKTWKVQDVRYTFKVDDSISAIENTPDTAADGAFNSAITYQYRYDGLNRLVHAAGSYMKGPLAAGDTSPSTPLGEQERGSVSKKFEQGYRYSSNGNLTAKEIYEPESHNIDDTWEYRYSNHAVTAIQTKAGTRFAMQYDAVGNMIGQSDAVKNVSKRMEFDSNNRIQKVIDPTTGTVKGRYDYDDQGMRVRKVSRREIDGVEKVIETISPSMYVTIENQKSLDGASVTGSAGAVNHIYLNGLRIAAVLPDGVARYYLTDSVDSVKVVVDDKGMVLSRMEYLPYGETWFQEDKFGLDVKNAPKFNSQELDKESGYYFFNARHYDPEIGRFVTADNIVDGQYDTQGWNRYSYVKNNPIVYKDPTGHENEISAVADSVVNLYNYASSGDMKSDVKSLGNSVYNGLKEGYNSAKNALTEKLNKANDSANKFISDKKQEAINDIIGTQDIKEYAHQFLPTSNNGDKRPLPVEPQPWSDRRYKATTGVEGSLAANILGFGEESPFMASLDQVGLHSTSVVHDNYVTDKKLGFFDGDFWASMPKSFIVAKEVEKINEPYRQADLDKYRANEEKKFNESVVNTIKSNREQNILYPKLYNNPE